jgi:hypothetical protein
MQEQRMADSRGKSLSPKSSSPAVTAALEVKPPGSLNASTEDAVFGLVDLFNNEGTAVVAGDEELFITMDDLSQPESISDEEARNYRDAVRRRLESLVTWPLEINEDDRLDDWSTEARFPKGIKPMEFADYLSPDLAWRESECRQRRQDQRWMWGPRPRPDEWRRRAADEQLLQRIKSDNFGALPLQLKHRIEELRLDEDWPGWLDRRENQERKSALESWDIQTRDWLYALLRDLILEKTGLSAGYVLKWLPQDKAADWQVLSQGWREKARCLDWANPQIFDPINGTLTVGEETIEVRVFRAENPRAETKKRATTDSFGGRAPKYDWFAFDREIMAILALDGELPRRDELRRHMDEWIAEHWEAQPEASQIRNRIARIYADPRIVPV